jgi:hypothetical protein
VAEKDGLLILCRSKLESGVGVPAHRHGLLLLDDDHELSSLLGRLDFAITFKPEINRSEAAG